MKVLITGGAGFIGSRLSRKYLERGDEVFILDDLSTGNYKNLEDVFKKFAGKIYFQKGSVLNGRYLTEFIGIVDVVIHLAAAVGVKYIVENPLRSLETNISGTEKVLKLARKYKKKIFIASSSEVYGDRKKSPLEEKDTVVYGPSHKLRWSYAASKLVDEFLAFAHFRTTNLPVIICRLFNIIGPGQVADYGMVVPRFVKQALENKPLLVHGDGLQTRTFTYIDDAVRAIVNMVDNDHCIGQVINIGGREEIRIIDLADLIIRLTGSSSRIVLVPYSDVYGWDFDDMGRRVPCLKKAKQLINYNPEYNLEESLKLIIENTRMKEKK